MSRHRAAIEVYDQTIQLGLRDWVRSSISYFYIYIIYCHIGTNAMNGIVTRCFIR